MAAAVSPGKRGPTPDRAGRRGAGSCRNERIPGSIQPPARGNREGIAVKPIVVKVNVVEERAARPRAGRRPPEASRDD